MSAIRTREQMIELLQDLCERLEAGDGTEWKSAFATQEFSFSVKLEIKGFALAAGEYPQAKPDPELELNGGRNGDAPKPPRPPRRDN